MSNRRAQVFLAAMTVVLGARAAEAASWLAKHAAVDFENGGFLDALAKHFGTRYAAERAAAQDVV